MNPYTAPNSPHPAADHRALYWRNMVFTYICLLLYLSRSLFGASIDCYSHDCDMIGSGPQGDEAVLCALPLLNLLLIPAFTVLPLILLRRRKAKGLGPLFISISLLMFAAKKVFAYRFFEGNLPCSLLDPWPDLLWPFAALILFFLLRLRQENSPSTARQLGH